MKPVMRTAVLALSLFAAPAFSAGQLQGQLNVQITIGTGCTVTNGTAGGSSNTFGSLSFGNYNDLANLIDGRSFGSAGGSSFGLQCSLGTAYSIALNSGQNATGGQRRMINSGAYVAYNLYQDSGRSQAWGDGGATGTGPQCLAHQQRQLGRIRRHMRLKAMLEIWLYIHVPATFMLLAALAAHIISVFYYW